MSTDRITEMTIEELTQLIDARIRQAMNKKHDERTMAEVNRSIRQNRIVPASGSKSALEMLQEDRKA